jgi:hypothetical protein
MRRIARGRPTRSRGANYDLCLLDLQRLIAPTKAVAGSVGAVAAAAATGLETKEAASKQEEAPAARPPGLIVLPLPKGIERLPADLWELPLLSGKELEAR